MISAKRMSHVPGLDSIRFIAALWVALGHGALPQFKQIIPGPAGQLVGGVLGLSFAGVAAVMLFFIVSGFCIHLPNVGRGLASVPRFYARRYIRIGLPLAGALAAMAAFGGDAERRGNEVLWSLYAELIYYTIYPALLVLAKRFGMQRLMWFFVAVSIALSMAFWNVTIVQEMGIPLMSLWGLSVWLMGCVLAERISAGELPAKRIPSIWLWRFGGFVLSVVGLFVRFHFPVVIGTQFSVLVFAIYAYFWMAKELCVLQADPPPDWLERFGGASYSLYLVHNVVMGGIADRFPNASALLMGIINPLAIAAATVVFYFVLERPSHLLAKSLKAAPAMPA